MKILSPQSILRKDYVIYRGMKSSIIFILLIAITACAKKNPNYKGNPIKDLLSLQQALTASVKPFVVKTKNLDLIYPNEKKAGKISLIVEDAKALYEALRVKPLEFDDTEQQQTLKTKQGNHLKCFELDPSNGPTLWGCELDIQYEEGSVSLLMDHVELDEEVGQLKEDYTGLNLTLKSNQSQKSTITLKQNSALVLYTLLAAPEQEIDPKTKVKTGQDYFCTKVNSSTADDIYTCELAFDLETGQVIEQS